MRLKTKRMKICPQCKIEKSLSDYHRRTERVHGVHSYCKPCRLTYNRERLATNASAKEKSLQLTRDWRVEHPDKVKAAVSAWQHNNLEKCRASDSRRKARKIQATPSWANEFFIDEIYDLARRRSEMTGFRWNVDHVVPLRSKRVCGLHVDNNLQVITAQENTRKGNRYWPQMPEEHLKEVIATGADLFEEIARV